MRNASSHASGSGDALRIALTLPGGIATGTFEAGAVSGLLAWTQEVNARAADAVVVDVIAGASAGALTGLLAARVLLAGDDPVDVFRRAWVVAPSLRALRGTGRWAPLSLRAACKVAHKLVLAQRGPGWPRRQMTEVKLDLALGCLRGLAREVPLGGDSGDPGQRLRTTSYLDWSRFALDQAPDGSKSAEEQWRGAIDSALASASHPLAFPARALNREAPRDRCQYRDVVNLPAGKGPLRLWYTDGGLIDNEPLGRCLSAVAEVDNGDTPSRLVILLRAGARAPIASDNPAWTANGRPRWTQTLWRVLDIVATHAADQDLQKLENVNARLRSTNYVAEAIAELVTESDETYDHLRQVLTTIQQERSGQENREHGVSASAGDSNLAELIETLIRATTGLHDKRQVDVAVFARNPSSLGTPPTGGLVGFIQRGHREDRFAAGFRSMLDWIAEAPQIEARIGRELIVDAAVTAQSKLQPASDRHAAWLRSPGISPRERLELTQLAFRALKIAWRDLDDYLDTRESRERSLARRRSLR